MATLAARLANNGTYYVSGGLDDNTFTYNGSYTFNNVFDYFYSSTDPLAGYEVGQAPWTIEFWFNTGPNGGSYTTSTLKFLQTGNGGGAGTGYSFYLQCTGALSTITFQLSNNFSYPSWASLFFSANTWYHVALVRNSGTSWSLYQNGTLLSTLTSGATFTWPVPSSAFLIIYEPPLGTKIAASRVTTGAALYTSSFTPSFTNTIVRSSLGTTTLLIAPSIKNLYTNLGTSGTTLLNTGVFTSYLLTTASPVQPLDTPYLPSKLFSNGVNMVSGYFDEVSSNNTTFATTGATNTKAKIYSNGVFAISNNAVFNEISYPQGSLTFISTSGAVGLNNFGDTYNTILNFGTSNDFTIEGWINLVNFTSGAAGAGTTGGIIWGVGNISSAGAVLAASQMINFNGSTLQFSYGLSSTKSSFTSINFGTLTTGTWYHFAVTRSGTTITTYLNGTQGSQLTGQTTATPGAGQVTPDYYNMGFFNGNIGNFKITNGRALYTSNFTPSNYPLSPEADTVQLISTANTISWDRTFIRYDGQGLNKPWFADLSNNRFHITGYNTYPAFSANTPFS